MSAPGGVAAPAFARSHRRPLWLGVLLAPWAPAFALGAVSVVDALARDDFHGLHGWPATFAVFALTLGVASFSMIALGLPAVCWLRSRGRLTLASTGAAALLAAGLVLLLAAVCGLPLSATGDLIGLACGELTGMVFSVLVGVPWRTRPGRSSAASATPPC